MLAILHSEIISHSATVEQKQITPEFDLMQNMFAKSS